VLVASILDGKGSRMPAFGGRLSAQQARGLVAYLRTLAPNLSVSSPKSAGGDRLRSAGGLYQRLCARCHAADGRGSELRQEVPAIPNFHSRRWHEDRGDGALLASILDGKGTRMPAFGGRLSTQQARDLVAYLRAFAPNLSVSTPVPADDFQRRFRELMAELDELNRQAEELTRASRKRSPPLRPAKQGPPDP
jgi:mono/diheme cytochrome c family protein